MKFSPGSIFKRLHFNFNSLSRIDRWVAFWLYQVVVKILKFQSLSSSIEYWFNGVHGIIVESWYETDFQRLNLWTNVFSSL